MQAERENSMRGGGGRKGKENYQSQGYVIEGENDGNEEVFQNVGLDEEIKKLLEENKRSGYV